MRKLKSDAKNASSETHNEHCTATKSTHNIRKATLTIEVFSQDCGCKEIILDTDNCNGEDTAQIIIALAGTLAPLVGAESASDILCDLANRETGGCL